MKYFLLLMAMRVAVAADPAFTIVVKTDLIGPSASNQFTLPLRGGVAYDFTIDWGDSQTQIITSSSSPTHTYSGPPGMHTVRITENVVGGFSQIFFKGDGDCRKLTEISHWGDVHWRTFQHAFDGCSNLVITATDADTAQTGTVRDFSSAWIHCSHMSSFPLLNASAGTNFELAWSYCTGLTSFPMLNTVAGDEFQFAWAGCTGLTSFPLLNTARGSSFFRTWSGCTGLTSFPLLNTARSINFGAAWDGCSGLTSFPLLNTAKGTDFEYTWRGCSGLTSFPLLNTAAGRYFFSAWCGCSGLTSFPALNTASGNDFALAWSGCTGLTGFPRLDLGNMTIGYRCFEAVRLDPESYSALLSDLSVGNSSPNVEFDGGFSTYHDWAAIPRADLINRGWTISDGGLAPPVITSPTTLNARVNSAFSYQILATNGPTGYGAAGLPAGFTLSGSTIAGTTPAVATIVPITVAVTGPGGTTTAVLTVSVSAAGVPAITSPTSAAGMRGRTFTYGITASNSPTGFTCSALPDGLNFAPATGLISGTPTTLGTRVLTIGASNAEGTGLANLTLTISATGYPPGGADLIVDNLDSDRVSTTGSWTQTSYTPGFYAANYLSAAPGTTATATFRPTLPRAGWYEVFTQYPANPARGIAAVSVRHGSGGSDVYATQVDQRQGGGTWQSLGVFDFAAGTVGSVVISSAGANGYVSADAVRFLERDGLPSIDLIVDNRDGARVTTNGPWAQTDYTPGFYGADYLSAAPGSQATAVFRPNLPRAGYFKVHVQYPSNTSRGISPITIAHDDGSALYHGAVDQRTHGGAWFFVGAFHFAAGAGPAVTIGSLGASGYVSADAVRFEQVEALPSIDQIVDNADGSRVSTTGPWTLTSYTPGFYATDYLSAAPGSNSTAIFHPNLTRAGNYRIFLRYPSNQSRGVSPVTVAHDDGTVLYQTSVDQRIHGDTWFPIGAFHLEAGSGPSVTVRSLGAGGYVSADAVRFVQVDALPAIDQIVDNADRAHVTIIGSWTASTVTPAYYGVDYLSTSPSLDKRVVFRPNLSRAATVEISIWYPSTPTRGTTPVTITYGDGSLSTVISVDQRSNGGEWRPLGTFPIDAGTAPSVTIGSLGTGGWISADAIRFKETVIAALN